MVAKVATWSLRAALKGKFPTLGPFGESLDSDRAAKAGMEIAGGQYRLAYYGFKADAKARKETHRFNRSYMHNQICETCMAERPNKNGDPMLTFKNFYPNAAHCMTELSHDEYVASSTRQSPWSGLPGFHVKSLFRDPMHTIFLGTAKEVLASCLGFWSRHQCLPGRTLEDQLRWVSQQQKEICRQAGLKGPFKTMTPSNTGLDTASEYPELGSGFKASAVKTSIWFFAKLAAEISGSSEDGFFKHMCIKMFTCSVMCPSFDLQGFVPRYHPTLAAQDFNFKLIASSLWGLQMAVNLMDHNDIIMTVEDSKVGV